MNTNIIIYLIIIINKLSRFKLYINYYGLRIYSIDIFYNTQLMYNHRLIKDEKYIISNSSNKQFIDKHYLIILYEFYLKMHEIIVITEKIFLNELLSENIINVNINFLSQYRVLSILYPNILCR